MTQFDQAELVMAMTTGARQKFCLNDNQWLESIETDGTSLLRMAVHL